MYQNIKTPNSRSSIRRGNSWSWKWNVCWIQTSHMHFFIFPPENVFKSAVLSDELNVELHQEPSTGRRHHVHKIIMFLHPWKRKSSAFRPLWTRANPSHQILLILCVELRESMMQSIMLLTGWPFAWGFCVFWCLTRTNGLKAHLLLPLICSGHPPLGLTGALTSQWVTKQVYVCE